MIQSGATLRSCTYLAACIDESLRLGPPVAAVPWRVADTGGASIDGQQIPEGTWVGTSLYALHRNSDYFDGPHEFRPERWIASETNTPEQIEESRKVFAPFLIGARMCAAKNMAMTELLLTMAEILYTTDFKPADGPEGHIGEGAPGHGVGRERKEEFQIRSQFVTVDHDGPVLQFRHR